MIKNETKDKRGTNASPVVKDGDVNNKTASHETWASIKRGYRSMCAETLVKIHGPVLAQWGLATNLVQLIIITEGRK